MVEELKTGTPIPLMDATKIGRITILPGIVLWALALFLWQQGGIDRTAVFFFDPARVAYTPFVALMHGASNYGMAIIAILLTLYLIASHFFKGLKAPLTIYLYTIFQWG